MMVPVLAGSAVGYAAYVMLDTGYRCHVATEVFGLAFSLAVIVYALQDDTYKSMFKRAMLAAASGMHVFHAAYSWDKNVLGRRE